MNQAPQVPHSPGCPRCGNVLLSATPAPNGVIKVPRVGIIADFTPNASTYGHVSGNARVVITEGLMGVLEPEELEAEVAHWGVS